MLLGMLGLVSGRRTDHDAWQKLAAQQEGLISRAQLIDLGLPVEVAENRLRTGRWSHELPGVYRTTDIRGPLAELARVWSAILYAGPGAAASGATALRLFGVIDRRPAIIEVSVPQPRQVRPQPGLRIRRAENLSALIHPVLEPRRTRLEVAVLDHAAVCRWPDDALDAVLRSTQRRLTTAARLRTELERRRRHRWRQLLMDVLAEVEDGVSTPLERRYVRDVERAHRLPCSQRNVRDRSMPGRSRYRDIWYLDWSVVVETDGREAHPVDEEFRDLRRDNDLQAAGQVTLRYGYRDVTARPCEVAQQVATVLIAQGWPGSPQPCCPICPVGPDSTMIQ